MSQIIKKIAILGERCSGTNFLEESITNNFNIEYTAEYGNKHFFCYNKYDKNATKETLFIGIIRNPIYWINSFSKELYHVPEINKYINNFLFNEFYSVEEKIKNTLQLSNNIFLMNNALNNNSNNNNKVNRRDLNYLNGKKYKNIFELRKVKNDFLINVMPNKVQNFILINYEDLLFNYNQTLQLIKDKFGLQQKAEDFVRIKKYKKSDSYNFVKQREITLQPQLIYTIWSNLDVKQENRLGYIPGDNNNFFKNKYQNQNLSA